MPNIVLRGALIIGLIVSTYGIASASPASNMLDQGTAVGTANVERIDYNWNHHHYHHRSWDKRNHQWHYYN